MSDLCPGDLQESTKEGTSSEDSFADQSRFLFGSLKVLVRTYHTFTYRLIGYHTLCLSLCIEMEGFVWIMHPAKTVQVIGTVNFRQLKVASEDFSNKKQRAVLTSLLSIVQQVEVDSGSEKITLDRPRAEYCRLFDRA